MSGEDFRYLLRVRYGECDAQQVVFNPRYGEYVDLAVNEFIRCLWGGYQQLLAQDLDIQVVHFSIDWQAPARFDEVLQLAVSCSHIGTTSFTIETRITRHLDALPIAESRIIYVLFQPSTGSKCALPDSMRRLLSVGAQGRLIDHSGLQLGTDV